MKEVEYEQGMTSVWSDGEKIRITNPCGSEHIKDNVDQIFGLGTFKKIDSVKYMSEENVGKHNTIAREYIMLSGYIPKRVKDDLGKK